MMQTELPPLSSEVAERTPNCITYWLRDLWKKHTGGDFSFITEAAWVLMPAKEYSSYALHNYEVVISLESLHSIGRVKEAEIIMDNGRLRENISEIDWSRFIKKKPLKGVKVGVVGGPEARIFAEMGADAVGFDPYLNKLPRMKLPKLEESSVYFTQQLAQKYTERFDLTLSSWLFDQGSGLTDFRVLTDILTMTKNNGFSIHNGNLMPELIQRLQTPVKLLEIVPSFRNCKLNSSDIYFMLQKK